MSEYYPPASFAFAVWFKGAPDVDASFSEVSGLTSSWSTIDIVEGGGASPIKLPKVASSGPIVLKRGLMLRLSPLFKWCKDTIENDLSKPIKTQDLAVALLGNNRQPLMVWSIVRAWPTKLEMDPFQADKSNVAMERIELSCSGITRQPMTILPGSGTAENAS